MNYYALVILLIFATYAFIIYKKFGILPSISQSYYEFEKLNFSSAFVLFAWSVSFFVILMQALNPYLWQTKLILIGAAAFLAAVPIAALYRQKQIGAIHYACSVIAIGAGFAAIIRQDWPHWYAFVPLALYIGLIIWMKKTKLANFTFWTELAAAGFIFLRLLIKP